MEEEKLPCPSLKWKDHRGLKIDTENDLFITGLLTKVFIFHCHFKIHSIQKGILYKLDLHQVHFLPPATASCLIFYMWKPDVISGTSLSFVPVSSLLLSDPGRTELHQISWLLPCPLSPFKGRATEGSLSRRTVVFRNKDNLILYSHHISQVWSLGLNLFSFMKVSCIALVAFSPHSWIQQSTLCNFLWITVLFFDWLQFPD